MFLNDANVVKLNYLFIYDDVDLIKSKSMTGKNNLLSLKQT